MLSRILTLLQCLLSSSLSSIASNHPLFNSTLRPVCRHNLHRFQIHHSGFRKLYAQKRVPRYEKKKRLRSYGRIRPSPRPANWIEACPPMWSAIPPLSICIRCGLQNLHLRKHA
ncbi:hypothetical protein M011DRAFT_320949 [Sporormia fimetaria CBS 119925]|uniref:Secreted protein n=1 Tax=Sporormia fimetaria CBS 119925 TaxID=1340428 RepID=A0A6A6VFG6_9PLEO|nr:hypothetical protein M011DRAFT_320949 [Sporormia fimetaria CBS 119925]